MLHFSNPTISRTVRAAPAAAAAGSSEIRVRLKFLDGLRGLAALHVVCHHALLEVLGGPGGSRLPRGILAALSGLGDGQVAVDVFIVLSGFCLMMPVAQSQDGELAGGVTGFLRRRAWRILPAYYGTLILTLAMIGAIPLLNRIMHDRWDNSLPAFSAISLLSHLGLFHNLTPSVFKIDYPMWSIASEWQIYLVFVFLLLPVWRRAGAAAAALAALAVGLAIHVTMPWLDAACPWFLGLFGFGMTAAVIAFSRDWRARRLRQRPIWGAATLLAAGGWFVAVDAPPLPFLGQVMQHDLAMGVAAGALMIYCALPLAANSARSVVLGVLEHPAACWLGGCSYSLYLLHAPLLALAHRLLRTNTSIGPTGRLALLLLVAVPAIVVLAHLFHLLFERPFLASARAKPAPQNAGNASGCSVMFGSILES